MSRVVLAGGPLAALAIGSCLRIPSAPRAPAMLGVAAWMAAWWISECVPIAFTAMLPLVALPLAGIAAGKAVAGRYVNSIIFLFIGGFLIAQALERTGLHKRLALALLARLHARPLHLVCGFALVTAGLSMLISNTATTMLMVTIAVPLLARLAEEHGREVMAPLSVGLLLTIAYAANIGGMGTPVGTPPNLVLLQTLRERAPAMVPSFLEWMLVGVPMVVVGLLVLFVCVRPLLARLAWQGTDANLLSRERRELGPMRRGEKVVAWVLTLTALAWMSRKGIDAGGMAIPGWASLLPYKGVDDGTVAVFGAAWLFLLRDEQRRPVLDNVAFNRLPWDIVILLGGGFALAFGMQHSGASLWLGRRLDFLASLPLPVMMLGIALAMTFLTEITSNTAITQVMLPVLAGVAAACGKDLLSLLLPATFSASCAFMLPVATPPNAIVFGTRQVPMREMNRLGLRLNLVMALGVTLMVLLLRPLLAGGVPEPR